MHVDDILRTKTFNFSVFKRNLQSLEKMNIEMSLLERFINLFDRSLGEHVDFVDATKKKTGTFE